MDALYRTALRMTKNETDAEDLVQEAFVKAYRFWDKFETGSNCRAWLFKIMTNIFINDYRSKSRSPMSVNMDDIDDNFLFGQLATLGPGDDPDHAAGGQPRLRTGVLPAVRRDPRGLQRATRAGRVDYARAGRGTHLDRARQPARRRQPHARLRQPARRPGLDRAAPVRGRSVFLGIRCGSISIRLARRFQLRSLTMISSFGRW